MKKFRKSIELAIEQVEHYERLSFDLMTADAKEWVSVLQNRFIRTLIEDKKFSDKWCHSLEDGINNFTVILGSDDYTINIEVESHTRENVSVDFDIPDISETVIDSIEIVEVLDKDGVEVITDKATDDLLKATFVI